MYRYSNLDMTFLFKIGVIRYKILYFKIWQWPQHRSSWSNKLARLRDAGRELLTHHCGGSRHARGPPLPATGSCLLVGGDPRRRHDWWRFEAVWWQWRRQRRRDAYFRFRYHCSSRRGSGCFVTNTRYHDSWNYLSKVLTILYYGDTRLRQRLPALPNWDILIFLKCSVKKINKKMVIETSNRLKILHLYIKFKFEAE